MSIPLLARISRATTLSWSQREFVLAARAQGAKNLRMMVREVLPNVLPAMFSLALLAVGIAIIAEGGLSLLGEQALANVVTIVYSFVVTFVIIKVLAATIGIRVSDEEEMTGLDSSEHAETAYHSDVAMGRA